MRRAVQKQYSSVYEQFGVAEAPATSPLRRALDYVLAIQEHDKQRPRGLDVADILRGMSVDETTLVAALLSDPQLRGPQHLAVVKQEFGEDMAELVNSVHWLNSFKECKQEMIQPPEQAERLRRMLLAMTRDVRAVLIKLAYRVQRLRILASHGYETRRCIARETLDIYAPIANRLGIGQLKWELEDLSFRYLEPQAYRKLAKQLEESRIAREEFVNDFVAMLKQGLQEEDVNAEVFGRPKHIYSIWRKMHDKHLEYQDLYDVRAVRVIVDKVSTCYAALGVVHSLWRHIPKEFDDYIANPKPNGYQSLHTAVIGANGKVVEVQIRTRAMHDFAENGVAAHWSYKEGGKQDEVLQRSISSLRHLLEGEDEDDADLLESFRAELFQDRVFVFTPNGDVMDLQRGATPLDFAYAIHTEVGHRCRGAKINDHIVPLTCPLRSGEKVEVLTARQGKPSRDWLNPHLGYLKSSRARAKVRHWFREQDRDQNIHDGKVILERELSRLGASDVDLADVARHFNMHKDEDLMAAVGRGEISFAQIAGYLHINEVPVEKLLAPSAPARKKTGISKDAFTIQGVGNLMTTIARCCKPMPGDPIIGFITRGRGVTVHRRDCSSILRLPDTKRARLVEIEWGDSAEVYNVDVYVEAYDRQGLLRDISAVLSNEKANLIRANTHTDKTSQLVSMQLSLEISDTSQLSRILDRFLQVPNVVEAKRTRG